jgi:hypothetical protein
MVTSKEVVGSLATFVNYSSNRDKINQFCEEFSREHRTLQQSSFRLILQLIEYMASDEYRTDGRNEESKKMAKTLLTGFREHKKKEFILQGYSEEQAESYLKYDFDKPSKYLPLI